MKKNSPPKPSTAADQLKVFVVNDAEIDRGGLRRMIEETIEKDMDYVGDHAQNDEKLIERIHSTRPDVVLVDLVLHAAYDPKHLPAIYSGIEAIKSIRSAFPNVKVIAQSHHIGWKSTMHKVGADYFLAHGAVWDTIRTAIRDVCAGRTSAESDMNIGHVIGLDLTVDSQMVVVRGTRSHSPETYLESSLFVFLCYLAKERKEHKSGDLPWLKLNAKDASYEIKRPDIWSTIVNRSRKDPSAAAPRSINKSSVSMLAAKINRQFKAHLHSDEQLVQTPAAIGGFGLWNRIPGEKIVIK